MADMESSMEWSVTRYRTICIHVLRHNRFSLHTVFPHWNAYFRRKMIEFMHIHDSLYFVNQPNFFSNSFRKKVWNLDWRHNMDPSCLFESITWRFDFIRDVTVKKYAHHHEWAIGDSNAPKSDNFAHYFEACD